MWDGAAGVVEIPLLISERLKLVVANYPVSKHNLAAGLLPLERKPASAAGLEHRCNPNALTSCLCSGL